MQASSCSGDQCSTQGNCSDSSCSKGDCGSSGCCSDGMVGGLFSLAMCAKQELMKEKLKASLDAKAGKKMDQVAELIIGAFMEKLKEKMENSEEKGDLEDKIMKIFKS